MRAREILFITALLGLGSGLSPSLTAAAPKPFFEIIPPASLGTSSLSPAVAIDAGLGEAIEVLNQTLRRLLGLPANGPFIPGNLGDIQFDGTQTPFLPRLEALLIQIRSSRYHLALEGGSDLEWLGAELFLNDLQGSLGIQIDLLDRSRPELKLALRISPAFVDIAWIQDRFRDPIYQRDFQPKELPPLQVNVGGALGLFFEKIFPGQIRGGIQAVVRPSVNTRDWSGGISLETAEAVFIRLPLPALSQIMNPGGRGLELEFRLAHLHREESVIDLIEEATRSIQARAPLSDFQNIFEAGIFLNWRN